MHGDATDPCHEWADQGDVPDDIAGDDPRPPHHVEQNEGVGKSTEVIRHDEHKGVRRQVRRFVDLDLAIHRPGEERHDPSDELVLRRLAGNSLGLHALNVVRATDAGLDRRRGVTVPAARQR